MISIIITSYKEPKTIGKAIQSIANQKYSGITDNFEILQVSPDQKTLKEGKKTADGLNIKNYIQIKDPCKGKPYALNMAFKKAKGEIIILTDGDVYFGKNAVKYLLKPFSNPKVGGVSGRPMAESPPKNTHMGYIGHLLADAANHKRLNTLKKGKFFPMSGYIMAVRKINIKIPKYILSDDAYISYKILDQGYKIEYTPKAEAYIKYPDNLKDFFKQKVRSHGGYKQLENLDIMPKDNKSRTFTDELKYLCFPINYAANLKEILWSLSLYPIRLLTWLKIFWTQKFIKKDYQDIWVRVDSTK